MLSQGDTTAATQLLGHPYIIIGIADEKGRIEVEPYKLLPADGRYRALIEGKESMIEVRGGVILQNEKFLQKVKIELL
jgi:FAD synthase